VLGALFYRFISENFAAYIEGGDDAVKTKGDFIYPSQLFANSPRRDGF
jgi:type I restriction enzyme M protein